MVSGVQYSHCRQIDIRIDPDVIDAYIDLSTVRILHTVHHAWSSRQYHACTVNFMHGTANTQSGHAQPKAPNHMHAHILCNLLIN